MTLIESKHSRPRRGRPPGSLKIRTHGRQIEAIIRATASFCGVTYAEILSPRRNKNIALPRQIAMYIAREHTEASLPDIAIAFDRDHTTVLYAVRKIARLVADGREDVVEAVTSIEKGWR